MERDFKLMETELEDRVQHLAGDIGERNPLRYDALQQAYRFIVETLESTGYEPTLDTYQVVGKEYRNIIAEKKGQISSDRILVVGAHYDTAGGTPGADDNASAVAVLLELARLLEETEPSPITIRMAFFTLEEPPYFRTRNMGSWVHARKCRQRKERIEGMIALEMLGYFSDVPGSQKLPLPGMKFFYPSKGNFIAAAGNFHSRRLVRKISHSLRRHTTLPVESVALPLVPGVGLSDHWSFWKEGYPAVILTDTAFLRNPHYHLPSDLPSTLDYSKMAALVVALSRTLREFGVNG